MTEQTELASAVSKNVKPTTEQLRVIAELVRNRILFPQASFSFVGGKLVKLVNWSVKSQSVRNVPQIELPANYCPITGVSLVGIDPDVLPKL